MKSKPIRPFRTLTLLLLTLTVAGCGQFVHVPPGQSVNAVLAKKAPARVPEKVRAKDRKVLEQPGDPQPAASPTTPAVSATTPPPKPASEPDLPLVNSTVPPQPVVPEDVAAYVTEGTEALQAGRNQQAVDAFNNALRLDPANATAWRNLALAYQNLGEDAKALEAFRQFKLHSPQ